MILEILVWLGYIFISLLVGLVTFAVIYTRWHYGELEAIKGLPAVVKPYFVGGSDPFVYNTVVSDEDIARVKKYGPVYGFYEGRDPFVHIADPELIRQILVKDFDHFQNKRVFVSSNELFNETIDFLPYEKWRAVRNHFTPVLTTGKIKVMSIQMLETIEEWMKNLKKKSDGKPIFFLDPKNDFAMLSLDITARTMFGTKINSLDDPNNIFMSHVKKMIFAPEEPNAMFTLIQMFPIFLRFIPFVPDDSSAFFENVVRDIIATRKKIGGEHVGDFVDVTQEMIDKAEVDPEFKRLGVKGITGICQALVFLLTGYETSSTTLSLMAFRMAKDKRVQDKLLEEIDAFFLRHDGKLSHENIGELVYLNAVMSEALRLDNTLVKLERVCTKDWKDEVSGLELKKGTIIQIPTYPVQNNEKYFPNPKEFKPERFMPENKGEMNSYAYLGFGHGPHNCVGMRFAREMIQMTMALLMKDFRFEVKENAELKLRRGQSFATAFVPFELTLVPRN